MTATTRRFDRGTFTLQELANKTGKSRRQISRWTSKPRSMWLADVARRHEKIRDLKAQGMRNTDIASAVGCSVSTVYSVLSKSADVSLERS